MDAGIKYKIPRLETKIVPLLKLQADKLHDHATLTPTGYIPKQLYKHIHEAYHRLEVWDG